MQLLGSSNEEVVNCFAHLYASVSAQGCLFMAPSLHPVFPTVGASVLLPDRSIFIFVASDCLSSSIGVKSRENWHVVRFVDFSYSAVEPFHFLHLISVTCRSRPIVIKPTNLRRKHEGCDGEGDFNVMIFISQL